MIGACFILVRRARNVEKWSSFLDNLLSGQYAGMAKAFSAFLELAIDLSKSLFEKSKSRRYSLSPIVLEALSTAMKHFVEKLTKAY